MPHEAVGGIVGTAEIVGAGVVGLRVVGFGVGLYEMLGLGVGSHVERPPPQLQHMSADVKSSSSDLSGFDGPVGSPRSSSCLVQ